MGFGTKVFKTFESLGHKECWDIMPEIIEAHVQQLLLYELLWTHKGDPSI